MDLRAHLEGALSMKKGGKYGEGLYLENGRFKAYHFKEE